MVLAAVEPLDLLWWGAVGVRERGIADDSQVHGGGGVVCKNRAEMGRQLIDQV